jgi:hypothetical protein
MVLKIFLAADRAIANALRGVRTRGCVVDE